MKAVVIGSGFGGLAAAVRLQSRGIETTLLEKRNKPGGRAYVYKINDYIFDGGPTVITAPYMFEELFAAAGKKLSDYVKLEPLDPFYRIFFHDGTYFDYSGDAEKQKSQIEKISPGETRNYEKFTRDTERIHEKGLVELGDKAFLTPWDMMKVAGDLLKLDAVRSVYSFVSKYFKSDKVRQVFSFHPLLVGGSPFRSPAIYALIHTLEKKFGVHYAMGGTGKIVDGLISVFKELGGTLILDAEVDKILTHKGKAKKVQLTDGKTFDCDFVISNADISRTYGHMIDEKDRPFYSDKKISKYSLSMSLVVIYFGVKKKYPDLAHHNIILSQRYKELLEDIFDKKIIAEDFSLYLHLPTHTDPSMAPAGHEACYVLAPVPHLKIGKHGEEIDWDTFGPVFENKILKFLNDHQMPGLLENLTVRHSINPFHFRDVLQSRAGNAFGVEPRLLQSAYFRPHNRSQDIKNLYLVGANTQPGAGMPGVLLSAKITDQLIAKDFNL